MERLTQSGQDTRRARRKASAHSRREGSGRSLHLRAVDIDVIPAHALDRPLLGALVTEDACWQFAVDAWQARKPWWFHTAARRRWRTDGTALEAKRARLRADAVALGLADRIESTRVFGLKRNGSTP